MADNIERSNKIVYQLFSNSLGRVKIIEPKGFGQDTRSYNRDTDSRGIPSKTEIDLIFFGNGADYISSVYETKGIEETVRLTKFEKDLNSLDEEYTIRYIQELDMGTYKRVNKTNAVTIQATEGGLYKDIKNRESDEYNLLNNFSADNIDILPLKTQRFRPLGRKIFIESLLKEDRENYVLRSTRRSAIGAGTQNSRPIPLKIIYNSDQDDVVRPANGGLFNDTIEAFQTNNDVESQGNVFFFQAEKDKNLLIDFSTTIELIQQYSRNLDTADVDLASRYKVEYRISERIENQLTIVSTEELLVVNDAVSEVGRKDTVTFNREITVLEGQSLGFVINIISKRDGSIDNRTSALDLTFLTSSSLTIQDITPSEDIVNESKCIKAFDFFERLVAKITGRNGIFKSDLFTTGDYKDVVVDNGFWARGFPDSYEDSNGDTQEIQINISFKDAFDSFNYLEPLCWFTEIDGAREVLRIETAKYTQQNFIGISLGDVDEINEEATKIDYFSKIEIGHDKSLEYEEVNGLDEPNGKSKFSTFIKNNNSTYSALSKLRVDPVGYELTRRFDFKNFPKEDTKRDNDLWMHDAKFLVTGDLYTHKIWSDRFDSLPTGIFAPETAWNLWFSPINRLYYGHGYNINRGLYHFPERFITFSSSNANQNLVTVANGRSLAENGDIEVINIENARVEPTLINFTFEMTQEIEDKFNGFTEINDNFVNNYFGLVEYLERGQKRYGRLVKLDASEKAQITLIKARI